MNVNDILRRVRWWAGDNSSTFIELTDIIDMVNDAQLEINEKAGVLTKTQTVNLVAGQDSYDRDTDVVRVLRVSLTSNNSYLKFISTQELDLMYPFRSDSTLRGTPDKFSVTGMKYLFHPTPIATDVASVAYVRVPVIMTLGTDVPSLPDMYHPSLARMVLANVKERDEDFEAARDIRGKVLADVASLTSSSQNATEDSYASIRDIEPYRMYGYVDEI